MPAGKCGDGLRQLHSLLIPALSSRSAKKMYGRKEEWRERNVSDGALDNVDFPLFSSRKYTEGRNIRNVHYLFSFRYHVVVFFNLE